MAASCYATSIGPRLCRGCFHRCTRLLALRWWGAVVGEYLGAAAGLGYLIHEAEGVFDVTGVFAGMVVLAAFVLVLDGGVTLAERRLLAWRPGQS